MTAVHSVEELKGSKPSVKLAVVSMLVLPIVVGHLLLLTGLPQDMMTCMVIMVSLPVMTVVPMLVRMHGDEGDYATGITVVTLVVSVVTIPLVQLLAFA